MAVTLAFVDKIDASPTVRLDLNTGVWSLQLEGTDFGFPDLERALVSTLLRDGGTIPASAYGLRTLTLRLLVDTTDADAVATQTQTLFRELNRANNILKFAPNTTAPVFFRTFRSSPQSVQVITSGAEEFVVVSLLAEPFAYGLKVTLGPYTVNQDPAAGSNPTYVDIPAASVTGDVETPALIRFTAALAGNETTLCAVRRRGTPSDAKFLRQAEALTAGTDTTVQANDPAFSGADSNYMRCTFTTSTSKVSRLTGQFPGDASVQPVDHRGTYRCYARVRASAATASTFSMQLKWGTLSPISGDTNTFSTDSTDFELIDLGLISFPSGNDPIYDGYSNVELKPEQSEINLLIGRTTGVSLDIDYLQFIPADQEFCTVKWAFDANLPVLDGPNDAVYSYSVDAGLDIVQTGDPSRRTSAIPMLTPNQVNRLFFLRKVDATWSHLIADTAVFGVRFWPRFLYVR